jgi:hypothetical protein
MRMQYSFDGYTIKLVDLSLEEALAARLIEGQKDALRSFGVTDENLVIKSTSTPPGTYAAVAYSDSGEVIGSLKLYSRRGGSPLPIESESSPLDPAFRDLISSQHGFCEIGSLWVSSHSNGLFLSKKLAACGALFAYKLGFSGFLGLAHLRIFRAVWAPLGLEIVDEIPSFPYPDARFQSFVAWHRGGLEAVLRHLDVQSQRRRAQPMPAEVASVS